MKRRGEKLTGEVGASESEATERRREREDWGTKHTSRECMAGSQQPELHDKP